MMRKTTEKGTSGALRAAAQVMLAAFAALVLITGCPNYLGEDSGRSARFAAPPDKPRFIRNETAFGFNSGVDLNNVSAEDSADPGKTSAVVALAWECDGALEYNVYFSDELARPRQPQGAALKYNSWFARGLEEGTEYFFWVEAKNPNGSTISDPLRVATKNRGPWAGSGDNSHVERGDYPRNIKVTPGNKSLTISWDLSDRVGWYEVYYAEQGDISHIDIYSPKIFKASDFDANGAVIYNSALGNPYRDSSNPGYTRPVNLIHWPNWSDKGYFIGEGNNSFEFADGSSYGPVYGLAHNNESPGTFYKLFEGWLEDQEGYPGATLKPYRKLDAAFARAVPWDGEKAGTPGTTIIYNHTSTTITGLVNGRTYEVWIRCPNVNGERGYGYVTGTPRSASAVGTPGNVKVSAPEDTITELSVVWDKTADADKYRIYASKFDYTPGAGAGYVSVNGDDPASYTFRGLLSGVTYYVWVVAERNGMPGSFGPPVSAVTGAKIREPHTGSKIIAGTDHAVKTAVYVEVNEHNPLNAGSYILEDGTYLFDYVILFAANIRNRTCGGSRADGYCMKNGVHVHFNENIKYILDNRNKYIKPLQDKGLKVLLGLLGDHDGIGFGSMNDAERAAFTADLKKDIENFGLDGVDFDDEWASKEDWNGWTNNYGTVSPNSIWTYPVSNWGYPTVVTVYRDPAKGIVPGNGILTTPSSQDMTRMWNESGESFFKTLTAAREALGMRKIICLYEYNTGRYITANGKQNGSATLPLLNFAADFALQPWYNQYLDESANGLERSKYAPFGMDLSGKAYAQGGAPLPSFATLESYAAKFKAAAVTGRPYNVLYFYGLEQASNLLKEKSDDQQPAKTKQEYISVMTTTVFGQKCLLSIEGGDFRKDW
jgi:hypothetical protein